jgi:hypothetical protein
VRLSGGVRRRPGKERGGEHDPKKSSHRLLQRSLQMLGVLQVLLDRRPDLLDQALSSAFFAFGMSTLSIASSTCW